MRKKELSKSARKVLRTATKNGVAYFNVGILEHEKSEEPYRTSHADSIMEGKKLFQYATADGQHWMYRMGEVDEPQLVEIKCVDQVRAGTYLILPVGETAPGCRQIKGKKQS